MAFINSETLQYPVLEAFIRALYPNTSFPSSFVPPAPFEEVQGVPSPSFDKTTQKAVELAPVKVDGQWMQQWEVVTLSPDAAANVAHREGLSVRNRRDGLLRESDWTQLNDAPVDKTAWATYRQALRDIPEQPGFPFNVNWPTQPV